MVGVCVHVLNYLSFSFHSIRFLETVDPFVRWNKSFRTSYVAHGRDQKKHQISWENDPLLAEPALSQIDNMGVFMIFTWEFIQKINQTVKTCFAVCFCLRCGDVNNASELFFIPTCKHYQHVAIFSLSKGHCTGC